MSKLAVFFPGTGYHCDKPLLYFARKVAKEANYTEQIQIEYDYDFDSVKDFEALKETYPILLKQVEGQLETLFWQQYEKIIFISKSMGTLMAAMYAEKHALKGVKHIWLTPVEEAYQLTKGDIVAFAGTKDPVSPFQKIKALSEAQKIPLYTYEDCNHSLECGNARRDLTILTDVTSNILSIISNSH